MRLSNGIRRIENVLGFVAGSAARGVARGAHNVRVEYQARQIHGHALRQRKLEAKLAKLSDDDANALFADQLEVIQRVAELQRGSR